MLSGEYQLLKRLPHVGLVDQTFYEDALEACKVGMENFYLFAHLALVADSELFGTTEADAVRWRLRAAMSLSSNRGSYCMSAAEPFDHPVDASVWDYYNLMGVLDPSDYDEMFGGDIRKTNRLVDTLTAVRVMEGVGQTRDTEQNGCTVHAMLPSLEDFARLWSGPLLPQAHVAIQHLDETLADQLSVQLSEHIDLPSIQRGLAKVSFLEGGPSLSSIMEIPLRRRGETLVSLKWLVRELGTTAEPAVAPSRITPTFVVTFISGAMLLIVMLWCVVTSFR